MLISSFDISRNNCFYSHEVTHGLKYFQDLFYFSKPGHLSSVLSSGFQKRLLLTVSSVTMQGKYIKGNWHMCLGTYCAWESIPTFFVFVFCLFFLNINVYCNWKLKCFKVLSRQIKITFVLYFKCVIFLFSLSKDESKIAYVEIFW